MSRSASAGSIGFRSGREALARVSRAGSFGFFAAALGRELGGLADGFEERDDAKYLKHSLAYYNGDGAPRIDYGDVKITKSQPGKRAYGAAGVQADEERKKKGAAHG